MKPPVTADDVLIREYREALTAARQSVTGDPEQLAFLMVAFKHGVPLDRVKQAVIDYEVGAFG